LIDPLPNLPEGVTLPPMPEKQRHGHKGRYNQNYSGNKQYYNDSANSNTNSSPSISPFQFSPLNPQPPSLIQITSFAEMAAFGGFNPNKYLSPAPVAMATQIQGLNFNGQQPQMFIPPMQYQNNMPYNGNAPAPQGNQNQGNYKNYNNQKNFNGKRSPKKNAQHRYEKKEGQDGKKQKGDKNQSEKKYVTKQKKTDQKADQAPKAEKTEAPAAKVVEQAAS